jgi:hypothetical protein
MVSVPDSPRAHIIEGQFASGSGERGIRAAGLHFLCGGWYTYFDDGPYSKHSLRGLNQNLCGPRRLRLAACRTDVAVLGEG